MNIATLEWVRGGLECWHVSSWLSSGLVGEDAFLLVSRFMSLEPPLGVSCRKLELLFILKLCVRFVSNGSTLLPLVLRFLELSDFFEPALSMDVTLSDLWYSFSNLPITCAGLGIV